MNSTSRAFIKQHGRYLIKNDYTYGPVNEFGRKPLQSTQSLIRAVRRVASGRRDRGPSGDILEGAVTFILPDDIDVTASPPVTTFEDGGGRYTVVQVDYQLNGVIVVLTQRMKEK